MLAAGLDGAERDLPVPDPVQENVFNMTDEERNRRGIDTLPGSLREAILLTENSDLVRRTLGDHVFNSFIQNKKIEWSQYQAQVTNYELKRYLPIL
jgi:glutamine synthetase